jgi:hypothetical protein
MTGDNMLIKKHNSNGPEKWDISIEFKEVDEVY